MLNQLQRSSLIPLPHGLNQQQMVLVGIFLHLLVQVHAGGTDRLLENTPDLVGQILVARKAGHGHMEIIVHAAEILIGDPLLPAVLPQGEDLFLCAVGGEEMFP